MNEEQANLQATQTYTCRHGKLVHAADGSATTSRSRMLSHNWTPYPGGMLWIRHAPRAISRTCRLGLFMPDEANLPLRPPHKRDLQAMTPCCLLDSKGGMLPTGKADFGKADSERREYGEIRDAKVRNA